MTEERQVVQCPNCGTRLRFEVSASMPERFKVRCSSCRQAFVVRRRVSDSTPSPRVVTPSPSAMMKKTVATGPAGAPPPASAGDPEQTSQLLTEQARNRRTFEMGEVVAGRYKIIRFIDQGGMGEVYEAHDSALGQSVALKTIRPTVAADEEALARFKREIQVARQVTHHNVCRIYDLGSHRSDSALAALYPGGEILFVTMELLRGETLSQRLSRDGAIDAKRGLDLARQMAAALDAAHTAGVVHRDFKSANVFLETIGPGKVRAVVTDFGLARAEEGEGLGGSLTIAGSVLGSPAYMAPEQVEGGKVTGAADLYALGVVLYEMATGQVPFRGDTPLATAVKRLTENPPSPRELVPGLDPNWERTILKCLERHPINRFASGTEVVDALSGIGVVEERPDDRTSPPTGRRRWLLPLVALLLLAVAVAINYETWFGDPDQSVNFALLEPPTVARPAVAVMGFRNVTGDEQNAWLSEGLAEMLSSELSAGGGVRLVPGENVARVRRELSLEDGASFAADTLQSLRQNLGSDYVVSGGYTLVGDGEEGQLRVDLRLQDTVSPEGSTALAVNGTSSRIFELVADAGQRLREALEAAGVESGRAEGTFRAANPESARLYTQGVARLNDHQASAAVELLERAVEIDTRNPRVHAALARGLADLGYVARAEEEAKLALELSAPLGPVERLEIEGLYRRVSGDWAAAVGVYEQLWRASPDDLEQGLWLADSLIAAGQPSRALEVARVLEQLPSAAADDVRILFVKARAAGVQGDFRQQAEVAARAADLSGQRGEKQRRAEALILEGWARRNLGEVDQAQGVTTEAEGLLQQLGDLPGVGRARLQRASLLYDGGDLESARRVFEQGIETYRELGDKGGVAQALNNLAVVLKRQGEMQRARELYQESLELSAETNNRIGIANSEVNLGGIDLREGELGAAEGRFQRALELSREVGDRNQEATSLYFLAVTQGRRGDTGAMDRQREALELRRSLGALGGVAASLVDLGNQALRRGDVEGAAGHFEEALEIAGQIRNRSIEAYARQGLGGVRYEQARFEPARELLEAALAIRRDLGEMGTESENHLALARLAVDQGEFEEAVDHSRRGAELAAELGAVDLAALNQAYQGRALVFLGRQGEARSQVARAQRRAEESEDLWTKLEILLCAARVSAASDRVDAARELLQEVQVQGGLAEEVPLRLEALLLDSRLLETQGRERTAQEGVIDVIDEAERRGLHRLQERAREASARFGSQ